MKLNRIRKTKKMLKAEAEIGMPIEDFLPERVTDVGLTAAAKELGVSKASLGYWMLRFGITTHFIAMGPGDEVTIRRQKERLTDEHTE